MTTPTPGVFIDSLSSADRKQVAMSRGLLAYFPDALALVARHSVRANEKHNPGEPVHWSREKSNDHEDCIVRHSASIAVDPNSTDDGQPHVVCRAWRALAALQLWAEAQSAYDVPPQPTVLAEPARWLMRREVDGHESVTGGMYRTVDAAEQQCPGYRAVRPLQ